METPKDIDAVLTFLLDNGQTELAESLLGPEDEIYLARLLAALRSGRKSIFIVEDTDEKLKYMFSNTSRAEAVSMLGKVIESTGRRLANSED